MLNGIRWLTGGAMVVLALVLFIPGDGLDWLNMMIAGYIQARSNYGFGGALLATYTLIPLGLLLGGCIIIPGCTQNIFMGLVSAVGAAAVRVLTNPVLLVIAVVMFVASWLLYRVFIAPAIEDWGATYEIISAAAQGVTA